MQEVAPCEAAQPVTETLVTAPDDENVTCARETSSAPATHALAPPITDPIAACTEPCGGCSGIVWFSGLPAAGSGASVTSCLLPSAPTRFPISVERSPGLPVGAGGSLPCATGSAVGSA